MPKTVRGRGDEGQAERVQPQSNSPSRRLDSFRLRVEDELGASIERALRLHKAETIAAAVDRKRSTIYRWQADPRDVPVSALKTLAHFDPDPEFLARVAGHLLSAVAKTALQREAEGRAVMVFHEIGPGRWGR